VIKSTKSFSIFGGKSIHVELKAAAKKAFANVRERINNERSIHQVACALERQLLVCRFVKIRNYLWNIEIAF